MALALALALCVLLRGVLRLTRAACAVLMQDLEMMKGSTVDSMSDAVEGADVMLYGVSLAYKESA